MKFIHLADLHIGRRLKEFSLLDDQKRIFSRILEIVDNEAPQAVLIAGDVYDKSMPSAEAVAVLDDFLAALAKRKLHVFLISGNHDSAERIAFGGRLMDAGGVHVSPVYRGAVEYRDLEDEFGTIRVHMLPFIKPANVRAVFPEEEINDYTDAVRVALSHGDVDTNIRNVLVTHQFVTGALRSDSEEQSVGGLDNVSAAVFDDYDYVALGHIHRSQKMTRETIRYAGTPLKYSFSEIDDDKSLTVVEMGEKGNISVRLVPLVPYRDLRAIEGRYEELVSKEYYEGLNREDYYKVVLTDEEDVYDAIGKLRTVYPNIMGLEYRNRRTSATVDVTAPENVRSKDELELFGELYEKQNNQPLSDIQKDYLISIIEGLKEGK